MTQENRAITSDAAERNLVRTQLDKVRSEIQKVIVGQQTIVDRILIALLCRGHVLLEGVPGLAKTTLLATVSRVLDLQMNRIQFTPDLLPSDLIGAEIYRPQNGEFSIRRGPVFANILLADEINRSPAKVQSALLQAMAERIVTIGEETISVPWPFFVLATQNPLEQEGTYPLPEAQLDRFLIKIKAEYPSRDEELAILQQRSFEDAQSTEIRVVMTQQELLRAQQLTSQVYMAPELELYIVDLVRATRPGHTAAKGLIEWGASPRATLALRQCAAARALLRGAEFATPEDVRDIAPDVLRHRVILSFEAESSGVSPEEAVSQVIKSLRHP
jgi:MoxR-like ATPase